MSNLTIVHEPVTDAALPPIKCRYGLDVPDDGCDILVLTTGGFVYQDTCMIDDQCGGYNSFYLDNHGDWDDIVAWAYMPTGKKDEEAANAS